VIDRAPAPNIVLIVADDLGFGDLGHYNGGRTHTPVVDQMMTEGLTLDQHYSASPVCAPARAALLTGRYPQRTGAVDTLETRGLDRVATTETTLADYLSRAGYRTGYLGKWHSGAISDRYHPRRRGFDEFVGFRGGWQDYFDWTLDSNGTRMRADGRYLTHVLADAAVDFLRRHRDERLFLQVAFNAPHGPFQAPDEAIRAVRDGDRLTTAVRTIYAMVNEMDRAIGRILGELAALGLDSRTLVMFTSDNGPYLGGEGEQCTTRYNRDLNGAKMFVLEGGIRVPMVLRWPDAIAPATTDSTTVHFSDWLPTLCGWAGCTDYDRPLDGLDLGGTLVDRTPPDARAATRFWQWNRYSPVPGCNAAMREGDWKLVYPAIEDDMLIAEDLDRADDRLFKVHPERFPGIVTRPTAIDDDSRRARYDIDAIAPLLFDVAADPEESHDRAAEQPARVARMKHALQDWFADVERDRIRAQRETLR
jgi:arylsulfatase A